MGDKIKRILEGLTKSGMVYLRGKITSLRLFFRKRIKRLAFEYIKRFIVHGRDIFKSLFILWIIVLCLQLFLQQGVLPKVIAVFFTLIAVILFREDLRGITYGALVVLMLFITGVIVLHWLNPENAMLLLPFGLRKEVTDDAMIVFSTFLFVLVTYLNWKSSQKQYEMTQLPLIKLVLQPAEGIFALKNEDERLYAKDIHIKIKPIFYTDGSWLNGLSTELKNIFYAVTYSRDWLAPGEEFPLYKEWHRLKDEFKLNYDSREPIFKCSHKEWFGIYVTYWFSNENGFRIPNRRTIFYLMKCEGDLPTVKLTAGSRVWIKGTSPETYPDEYFD